jgi:protein-disulfide isomerase
MLNLRVSQALRLALLSGAVAFPLMISDASAQALTKDDVKAIVAETLKENPGMVVEALENYRVQEEKKMEQEASAKVKEFAPHFADKGNPSMGPEDAKITIVEFFDYACGYCKRALPDVQAALSEHKDVRVVFQEFPILSPLSQSAAKYALAAHKQGKYFEYHSALMKFEGQKTDEALAKIAGEVGLNVEQLKKDAASPDIDAQLRKSADAAREIGIQGTPAFIVGDTLYRGYLGPDGMKKAIEDARKTTQ